MNFDEPLTALSSATANLLAAAFTALAEARNEDELFAAAVLYLRSLGPLGADLHLVTAQDDDGPTHCRMITCWRADVGFVAPREPEVDVRQFPITRLWVKGHAPVLLSDISSDPRADPSYRAYVTGHGIHAQIMLPLHSETIGRVIGVLLVHFGTPRVFTGEERHVLKTLSLGLASFLASRRLLAAQEQALRDAERQRRTLQVLLDNLTVGVYMAEAGTGGSIHSNNYGIELYGQRRTDPDGTIHFDAYPIFRHGTREPIPREELPLYRAMETGEQQSGIIDLQRPDGELITLELSAAPIRDETGEMFAAVVVSVDITERLRAEAERAQIHDELIRAQAQALAERSTPLIPLSDEVVAMPIIGSLDPARADQVVEALLAGCAARKARYAILDVTGVPHADTTVAAALIRAAAAVRLLGVEPVLTGIRPEVARTLVGLDIDLKGLVTLSTLQDGILYATRKR
jgi:anti-anti-sigma regulatory factor/PAS domain-containing protein